MRNPMGVYSYSQTNLNIKKKWWKCWLKDFVQMKSLIKIYKFKIFYHGRFFIRHFSSSPDGILTKHWLVLFGMLVWFHLFLIIKPVFPHTEGRRQKKGGVGCDRKEIWRRDVGMELEKLPRKERDTKQNKNIQTGLLNVCKLKFFYNTDTFSQGL